MVICSPIVVICMVNVIAYRYILDSFPLKSHHNIYLLCNISKEFKVVPP